MKSKKGNQLVKEYTSYMEILNDKNSLEYDGNKIREVIESDVRNAIDMKDINELFELMHLEDVHSFMPYVQRVQQKLISEARRTVSTEYQRFQNFKRRGKEVHDYNNKSATIYEAMKIADTSSKKYYGISVRMIGKLDEELNKIQTAINKIEEALKMPITNFNDDEEVINNDNKSKNENESGDTKIS